MCSYSCRLHDLILEEAEEHRKWFELWQQLLARLGDAPGESPMTRRRFNFVERQLVDQTHRVLNLTNISKWGCYRCVTGGMHYR